MLVKTSGFEVFKHQKRSDSRVLRNMSGVKSFQWPCLKVFFVIGDPPRDKWRPGPHPTNWRLLAACWGSHGVPDLFPSRVESSSPNRVLYGNDMRAEFCRDVFSSKHLVLSPLAWRSPVEWWTGTGMGMDGIFGMNSTKFWYWTCGIALTWHWKYGNDPDHCGSFWMILHPWCLCLQ
jgi:hypothetical protein